MQLTKPVVIGQMHPVQWVTLHIKRLGLHTCSVTWLLGAAKNCFLVIQNQNDMDTMTCSIVVAVRVNWWGSMHKCINYSTSRICFQPDAGSPHVTCYTNASIVVFVLCKYMVTLDRCTALHYAAFVNYMPSLQTIFLYNCLLAVQVPLSLAR